MTSALRWWYRLRRYFLTTCSRSVDYRPHRTLLTLTLGVKVLLLEIWLEAETEFTSLIYAGPLGDDSRKLMNEGSYIIEKIWANSHFDAMTQYHEQMNWEPYTTNQKDDYNPYPEEWIRIQAKSGIEKWNAANADINFLQITSSPHLVDQALPDCFSYYPSSSQSLPSS